MKKKIVWAVVAAAVTALMVGASYLGYDVIAHSSISLLGLVMGVGLLAIFPMLGYMKSPFAGKEWDWTLIVGGGLLIAHYFVAVGTVYQAIDIHSSLMVTCGLFGLVLLTTRAEMM